VVGLEEALREAEVLREVCFKVQQEVTMSDS
jgi:hypothetical protein